MSPVGHGKSVVSRVLITVRNLLVLLTVPGVVLHELGHALTCRLLGVETSDVVLFQWPEEFTRDLAGGGYVAHEETESTMDAVLIAVAPLVVNTVCALVALFLARTILTTPAVVYSSGGRFAFGQYVQGFQLLDPGHQVAALLTLWVGVVAAWCGFPSEQDFRSALEWLDELLDTSSGSKGKAYALQHVYSELAAFYTFFLVLGGLFGFEVLLAITHQEFLILVLIGVPFLLLRVGSGESDWLPDRKIDQLNRVRRASRRASDGEKLEPEEIEFLVERLSSRSRLLRQSAAGVLMRAAENQPALVGEWDREILAETEGEWNPTTRNALQWTVYRLYEHTDERERVSAIGMNSLTCGVSRIAKDSPVLLWIVARDDPDLLEDALPEMIEHLDDVQSPWRSELLDAMGRVVAAESVDPELRNAAVEPPIPENGTRTVCTETYSKIVRNVPEDCRPVAGILLRALDDTAPVRSGAIRGLGFIGEAYPEAGELLVDVVVDYHDDDLSEVRTSVVRTLGQIAKTNPDVVSLWLDRVLPLLESDDLKVRRAAARSAKDVSKAQPARLERAVDPLLDRLDDEEGAIRSAAALALANIAEEHPETVVEARNAFVQQLNDEHDATRANCVLVLWRLGKVSPEYVKSLSSQLLDCLDDDRASVHANALGALGEIAAEYPEAVVDHTETVHALLDDSSGAVRTNALDLLAKIAEQHPEHVRPSIDSLREFACDDDEIVRHNATEALAEVVNTYPELVVPARQSLIAQLADDDEDTRAAAAKSLAGLAEAYPLLIECHADVLVDALDDEDERVREHAVTSLASIYQID